MKAVSIYVFLLFFNNCYCFDLIFTPLIVAGMSSLVAYKYRCKFFGNCCTEKEIPADIGYLNKSFNELVYGQPFLNEIILKIRSHWHPDNNSFKPLTMSFHGSSGVGKNYVVNIIAKALYSNGLKNPHVHYFSKNELFVSSNNTDELKKKQEELLYFIEKHISRCPKELFIFDEVDNLTPGILDRLNKVLKYSFNTTNLKKSIFIFLTNSGQSEIMIKTMEFWQHGISRDELKLNDFHNLKKNGAFSLKGGFSADPLFIDLHIPFLPLEKEHIKKCIIKEFKKYSNQSPDEKQIQEILEYLSWGPQPEIIFSKTGCKKIAQNVAMPTVLL